MLLHAHRYILLAGAMLGLLVTSVSASAASNPASHSLHLDHTQTMTHAQVEQLVAHGERLRLTSISAEKTEVRLFTYGRVVDRGGFQPAQYAPGKVWISRNTHVIFNHPGAQWVTLHVNPAYSASLLRAGTITEGYFYAGYELLH